MATRTFSKRNAAEDSSGRKIAFIGMVPIIFPLTATASSGCSYANVMYNQHSCQGCLEFHRHPSGQSVEIDVEVAANADSGGSPRRRWCPAGGCIKVPARYILSIPSTAYCARSGVGRCPPIWWKYLPTPPTSPRLERRRMPAHVERGIEVFRYDVGGIEVGDIVGKLPSCQVAYFLLTAIPGCRATVSQFERRKTEDGQSAPAGWRARRGRFDSSRCAARIASRERSP